MYSMKYRHRHNRSVRDKEEYNHIIRPISFPTQKLSRNVDLRRWMTPIEHQEDMNTCCANAFAGVCEYLIKRTTGHHKDISRLFIYYNAQILDQRTLRVKDYGVNQREIALGIRKYGFCSEDTWPYDKQLLNYEPSSKAYKEASKYTVNVLTIPFEVQSILTCLHKQIPVIVDIKLVEDVGREVQENNGYLTIPHRFNTFIKRVNSHSVLLVGYDKDTKHFIARNSWGPDWGNEGYFHIPFDYLTKSRLIHRCDGLWTITKIVPRNHRLPSIRQLVA